MTRSCVPAPAVWFPTIRAGTGADVFTRRLCDGLNAHGVRAEISWLPHRAEYLPWTVSVPTPPAWANMVHVNSWLPKRFWPGGLPVVVTVHHLVHDPAYWPFRSPAQAAYHALLIRSRELQAIRSAAAVTTVSNFVRDTIVAFSGRQDIAVIHNWIDGDVFTPGEQRGGRDDGTFRLFMAGSHTRRKGCDLLPALAHELGPAFEIRCAGGMASQNPSVPNVIQLGRISESELIHEYQACDAVVSLSRYEGFGYTALEGMACGKPFVGFRGSGLGEVVEDGVTGFLSAMGDISAMAVHCRELAAYASVLKSMGDAGRRRAVADFPGGVSIDAYMALYRRLLGRAGGMPASECPT